MEVKVTNTSVRFGGVHALWVEDSLKMWTWDTDTMVVSRSWREECHDPGGEVSNDERRVSQGHDYTVDMYEELGIYDPEKGVVILSDEQVDRREKEKKREEEKRKYQEESDIRVRKRKEKFAPYVGLRFKIDGHDVKSYYSSNGGMSIPRVHNNVFGWERVSPEEAQRQVQEWIDAGLPGDCLDIIKTDVIR